MKKIIFTLFLACVFIFSANAQGYNSAVGVKLGGYLTGTYKKLLKESMYVDFYAGIDSYGSNVLFGGAMVQLHKPIESVDNLYWYYGGGAFFGAYSGGIGIGINGVLGLDYSFDEIPLNISIDWTPGFYLTGGYGFYGRGGAVSLRYILGN